MNTWYSAAQLAGLPGMPSSRYGVSRQAEQEKWQRRARDARGGGYEYSVDSLPAATRAHLVSSVTTIATAAGRADAKPIRKTKVSTAQQASDLREKGLAEAAGMQGKPRERFDARVALLAAFDQFHAHSGMTMAAAMDAFCEGFNNGEMPVELDVRRAVGGISPRSLMRWRSALASEGAKALGGKYKGRAGASTIDSNPELVEYLHGMLYTFPHATAVQVMNGMRARFRNTTLPSVRRLRAWLAQWKEDNKQLFCAIRDPDMWRNKYRSSGGNASEHIVRLNQMWEMDSTPTDVLLNDGKRHAIVGVIDVFARRVKLHVARTSNSAAIGCLMRKTLLDWGVPELIKKDNGADYTSKHITALQQGLGIAEKLCPPFTPEGKPHIERVLGTFSHEVLPLLPGYVGHNVATRQALRARQSFAARMSGKSDEFVTVNLSPEELQEICDIWCETTYANRVHGSLNGKTPMEMVCSWQGTVRRIEDERALDILLMPAPDSDGWRTVTKKGVKVDGAYYDHPELGGREGSRVFVRLDENELQHIYLFSLAGAFICRAFAPEYAGLNRKDMAMKKRELQGKKVAEEKRALKAASRKHNTPDTVRVMQQAAIDNDSRIARFPQKSAPHSTDALRAAGEAARAGDAPAERERTEEERKAMAVLQERKQKPVVVQEPDDPKWRYSRWVRLDRRLQAAFGDTGVLTPAEENLWRSYQRSSEFKSMKRLFEACGLQVPEA